MFRGRACVLGLANWDPWAEMWYVARCARSEATTSTSTSRDLTCHDVIEFEVTTISETKICHRCFDVSKLLNNISSSKWQRRMLQTQLTIDIYIYIYLCVCDMKIMKSSSVLKGRSVCSYLCLPTVAQLLYEDMSRLPGLFLTCPVHRRFSQILLLCALIRICICWLNPGIHITFGITWSSQSQVSLCTAIVYHNPTQRQNTRNAFYTKSQMNRLHGLHALTRSASLFRRQR